MAITIKEIAEMLNISQATVSLALNKKSGVNKETSNKVWKIAKDFGYTKRGSQVINKNILLIKYIESGIAIEQNGDFVSGLVDGIENRASSLGYNIIIKNVHEENIIEILSCVNSDNYQGCIVLATEIMRFGTSFISKIKVPIVCVDNMLEYNDIDCVVMDNISGIFNAVKYLSEIGHKKVGYIDSTIRFENFIQRREGYRKAIKKLGLVANENFMIEVYPNINGSYEGIINKFKKGINLEELPTAYVAGNDSIAIGSMKAFKEKGIKIPTELSIIGFDDIPSGQVLEKSLTTMKVNKRQIGELAIARLDGKIKEKTNKDDVVKILTRTKLIVRESTDYPRS